MLALVTGGASSGKSAYAESLALSLPGPHCYLASMMRGGAEAQARIERHRALRAGKGFQTIEMQDAREIPLGGTVLLEDLGNLVANGWEDRLNEIMTCENAVVVGNEVGADGVRYQGFTAAYIERLGGLACRVAAQADAVVEVVAGIPCGVKVPGAVAHRELEGGQAMVLVIGGLASGKRTYAESLGFPAQDMAFDVHERLREGADAAALARELAGKRVVTCAEVGSGIVPLDAGERAWREQVGALCQQLAVHADVVVRMVCGIPVPLRREA